MKRYIIALAFTVTAIIGAAALPMASQTFASQKINCGASGCAGSGAGKSKGSGQTTNLAGNGGIFETVTNVLLFLVGSIAVIMMVVGGFKYVVSNGDSNSVQSAKNTILYAVIGLVVAIIAYAVVRFVITQF